VGVSVTVRVAVSVGVGVRVIVAVTVGDGVSVCVAVKEGVKVNVAVKKNSAGFIPSICRPLTIHIITIKNPAKSAIIFSLILPLHHLDTLEITAVNSQILGC
jgi:hypothetical protein